jgi:putative transposase
MLVDLHPMTRLARLVGEVKGVSSHLATQVTHPGQLFRWQEGYWARSICPEEQPIVVHYIDNQRAHHANRELLDDLEPREAP